VAADRYTACANICLACPDHEPEGLSTEVTSKVRSYGPVRRPVFTANSWLSQNCCADTAFTSSIGV